MTMTIRAHFVGKVLVPEEPFDLPLELELRVLEPMSPPEVIRDRLARLAKATGHIKDAPHVPLEALRRENLYDERA